MCPLRLHCARLGTGTSYGLLAFPIYFFWQPITQNPLYPCILLYCICNWPSRGGIIENPNHNASGMHYQELVYPNYCP